MIESEPELFEAELRKLKPAKAPELVARLEQQVLATRRVQERRAPRGLESNFWELALRWLIPATAVVAILVTLASLRQRGASALQAKQVTKVPRRVAPPFLKADNVEVDQQMVLSFDAVARLPGGEPVRFRCTEWMDEVTLRDSAKGVAMAQRTPRLEIVPVRFETY